MLAWLRHRWQRRARARHLRRLAAQARSPDPTVRVRAAAGLAELPGANAVPELIQLLWDAHATVREAAQAGLRVRRRKGGAVGNPSEQPEATSLSETHSPPATPLRLEDHIAGVLTVAVGWGVALFVFLWWQCGFSWWYPLCALVYAVVHPVLGKLWYLIIAWLSSVAVRLWQLQPKFEISGVVEEMYVALFWPVLVPLVLPILLVAISVGATFRPAEREAEGKQIRAFEEIPPGDSVP